MVEIAGAIYEEDSTTWKELLALIFQLVNSEDEKKVDGGLQCLNGLFNYMVDEFNDTKDDLLAIFNSKLAHSNLDV